MNFTILRFDTLDSTNTEAANQARHGADEGLCIIARQQTAGRGRHSRTWSSGADSGLYFSIVLRPTLDLRYLSLITLMTGVAVHDSLEEFGVDSDIKWVNDLLVDERKISGILAETVDTPAGLAVVVGIGVNLTSESFPDEIALIATSIKAETGQLVSADALAEVLTRYLAYFYDIYRQATGAAEIIKLWRDHSSYFSGKHVRVAVADDAVEGVTDGLEENGALRIIKADGSIMVVQAGDVERIRSIA